jgi:CDP-diacylglycerol--glycerol-3-phosphate 3-phosphatidyltransferase
MLFKLHNQIKHIPNILTNLRILLILPVCFLLAKENRILASLIFCIIMLSDFLDGHIARKYSAVSEYGKCMDPIADKLVVIILLILLMINGSASIVLSILIVAREILISGIREFYASKNISIPVSKLGKIKTSLQLTSILLLIMTSNSFMFLLSNAVLFLATIATVLSAYQYINKLKNIAN